MSFVLAPKEIIKTKVKAVEPLDFGGKKNHSIEVHWKALSVEEIRGYQDRLKPDAEGITDEDLLLDIVVNIPGVEDEAGNDIPFNEELVHRLMDVEWIRKAFAQELQDILFGKDFMKRVREKN